MENTNTGRITTPSTIDAISSEEARALLTVAWELVSNQQKLLERFDRVLTLFDAHTSGYTSKKPSWKP